MTCIESISCNLNLVYCLSLLMAVNVLSFVPNNIDQYNRQVSSNCSKAFNFTEMNRNDLQLGSLFQNVPINNFTLKVINSGSGTTGTNSMKEMICSLGDGLRAAHHMDRCEKRPRFLGHVNPSVVWKANLLCCLGFEFIDKRSKRSQKAHKKCNLIKKWDNYETVCSSRALLDDLRHVILEMSSKIEALSDSPVDFLFPEFLQLAALSQTKKNLIVLQSVRDPSEWTKKRFMYHSESEIICRLTTHHHYDELF